MSGALTENQKLRLKIVRLHNENRNEYNIARKLHVCPKFVHYTIRHVWQYTRYSRSKKSEGPRESEEDYQSRVFKKVTPEKCQKFISALPSRLEKIIASRGEYCYE